MLKRIYRSDTLKITELPEGTTPIERLPCDCCGNKAVTVLSFERNTNSGTLGQNVRLCPEHLTELQRALKDTCANLKYIQHSNMDGYTQPTHKEEQ